MKNSASLLADLLERWTVPSGTQNAQHRGGGAPDSSKPEYWSSFRDALRWLTEVEGYLDAMDAAGDDTSMYRASVPAWYRALFSFDVAWADSAAKVRPAADSRDIALLRALGQSLDAVKYAPKIHTDQIEGLRAAIANARDLVVASTVDDDARRYLLGLIAEIDRCLNDLAAFGTAHLRDLVFALGGAMHAAAETSVTPDEKPNWKAAAQQVMVQLVGGGGAAAIGAATTLLLGG